MTMYQGSSDYFEPTLKGEAIPEERLEYFRRRLWHRVQDALLEKFAELSANEGLTKADLARMTRKDRATISRAFTTPGNLTLDTISDLLLAMEAELEPDISELSIKRTQIPNKFHEFLEKIIENSANQPVIDRITSEYFVEFNNVTKSKSDKSPNFSFKGQNISQFSPEGSK